MNHATTFPGRRHCRYRALATLGLLTLLLAIGCGDNSGQQNNINTAADGGLGTDARPDSGPIQHSDCAAGEAIADDLGAAPAEDWVELACVEIANDRDTRRNGESTLR